MSATATPTDVLGELVLIGLTVALGDALLVLDGQREWAIVCADCLSVMPTLPDKSVAHVITDPPYEAEAHTLQRRVKANPDGRGTQRGGGDTRAVVFAPVPFPPITAVERHQAAHEAGRLARRWMLFFCQVEASTKWGDAIGAAGGRYRRTGIWVKPDGQPQLNGLEPGQGYEAISICHSRAAMRWNGGGRVAVFVHNTARFDGVAEHVTPKPLSLMLELAELFTDPDELILDPFAGSGTTGVACLRLGRRFIGVEKDPKYAAIARERLEAESQGLSLRDARAGQLSLLAEGRR